MRCRYKSTAPNYASAIVEAELDDGDADELGTSCVVVCAARTPDGTKFVANGFARDGHWHVAELQRQRVERAFSDPTRCPDLHTFFAHGRSPAAPVQS